MHKPTAGQATTEYIAAIALIAVILALAAPAVGAPSIASAVVQQMQRAVCIAGLDICDARMAADAGLAPCPLGSETTGHEATATAFSIELGHRLTLTVVPNSDGSVTVVRTAGGIAGVSTGYGWEVAAGPAQLEAGGDDRAHRAGAGRGRLGVPQPGRRGRLPPARHGQQRALEPVHAGLALGRGLGRGGHGARDRGRQ